MILYGLLFGLWPCVYLLLQDYTFFSEKQIRNYISLGHSISCSIFSGCSLLCNQPSLLQSFIVYLSTSYFIWDTFYIFLKQKRTESLYLYHHCICLLLVMDIYYKRNSYLFTSALFIGEFSNIWNYVIYDMIQRKVSQGFIVPMKILQVCWFCYLRVYWLTYLNYYYFHELVGYFIPYSILSIYGLGILWGCKQFYSTIIDIKNYYYPSIQHHPQLIKTE